MKLAAYLMILTLSFTLVVSAKNNNGENMVNENSQSDDTGDLTIILDQLSWLTGRWEGEAFGGKCEEIWSPPSAGSMVGLFKVWKEGKVSFYEFETITIDSSGLALNVKHFDADLTGWEEKDKAVVFPFVSAGKDEINFEGISYHKISEDSIKILLDSKDSEGNIQKIEIDCKRAE